MNEGAPVELIESLRSLFIHGESPAGNWSKTPAFRSLEQLVAERYQVEQWYRNYLLTVAIRNLGLIGMLESGEMPTEDLLRHAADALHAAFFGRDGTRTYLCPLDCAGVFPDAYFGRVEVRRFSAVELDALVHPMGRESRAPSDFDCERFSEFHWVVIREAYQYPSTKAPRVMSILNEILEPYGIVRPHKRRFPEVVEDVLTFLMLSPWEDCADYGIFEWRPFYVPWIYMIQDDLFTPRNPAPRPDSLTWGYHSYTNGEGLEVDFEAPEQFDLDPKKSGVVSDWLTSKNWEAFLRARQSALFPAPMCHFLSHALHVRGIDEFQAHMLAIEAGLGLAEDYGKAGSLTGPNSGKDRRRPIGARGIKIRLVNLLDDPMAEKTLDQLYDVRSAYLHGRSMPEGVTNQDLLEARRLARLVAVRLMQEASANPGLDRQTYLNRLYDA
ncbi:hypothetical protein [Hydrocarboniphaga effusa]|uniref:Apea-like HEPN domain-containing protein n=1 Tax=Hydrocarboniphaga effusa AP103 TaxID=1172194 RepID=I8TDG8_9GAMM|nr:hypothetical protein [Hydrocarboniphaga effusa]EIT72005.1 hypothetical protein WQQ_21420 [Hydrocarboniphaga effusa AP103]